MKFIVSLFLLVLLSFTACLYFPWWSIAVVAFVVAVFIPQGPGRSYLTGFLAISILWAALALLISAKNEFLFAHKISLLILKIDNISLLIFATALIGGMVAGLAATAGAYFRRMFKRDNRVVA